MLVVDGALAFTGGMNIRAQFTTAFAGVDLAHDTHFRVEGPAVGQLLTVFAHDWAFTTDEQLGGAAWEVREGPPRGEVAVRVVPSGPDRNLACTHSMIMGALAVAQRSVQISSPYFLPDLQLIGALGVAGRRGGRRHRHPLEQQSAAGRLRDDGAARPGAERQLPGLACFRRLRPFQIIGGRWRVGLCRLLQPRPAQSSAQFRARPRSL